MLKRIGAEESGEFKAVASGTLPSGRPVVVNADGTVSVISETTISENIGSATVFESGAIGGYNPIASTFDSSNNKVVLAYQDDDNSDYGTAIVGTVSGNSISFGSPVVFNAGATFQIHSTFDSSNNKVVICYKNDAATENGTAIVGTVSGTSISFGSAAEFETSDAAGQAIVFDSNSNRVVIIYRDGNNSNYGTAIVCTISGTSISFNTPVVFASSNLQRPGVAFDSDNNKIVIAYQDVSNSNKGTAIVGTVSGTSISFGSSAVFDSGALGSTDPAVVYDTNAQKIVIVYMDEYDSNVGSAIVGTVSGTSISFGTAVVFESGSYSNGHACYDAVAKKIVIAYRDHNNSNYGTVIVGTVSGTSISFGSPSVFEAAYTKLCSTVFDSNSNKVVIAYQDNANSSYGTALVYQTAYVDQNITSENYIGMSRGALNTLTQSEATGSDVEFDNTYVTQSNIGYDSNADRVVIAYRANHSGGGGGEAVVGTVSGTSISFGTPVVFNSNGSTRIPQVVFDSSNNKIVIAYRDDGNSNYSTAIVGTVDPSDNSISFGTPVVYNSSNASANSAVFDSDNNKVIVGSAGTGGGTYKVLVGTVSGTSISFGSATSVVAAYSGVMTYDTTNSKVILGVYNTNGNGQTYVGTVSGTSITFGSANDFSTSGFTGFDDNSGLVHDSENNKIIIAFKANDIKCIVGTVSGTSMTFGSEVVVESNASKIDITYDTLLKKPFVSFRDDGNSYYGTVKQGTVSGTSISFGSATVFKAVDVSQPKIGFASNKVIFTYADSTDSNHGKAIAYQGAGSYQLRAEVASGNQASIDIIGSVSTNQSGLTAGQQYFVQTDGTIGTTADDPSVLAGTAISATELLVKT
jgi:hypothetical protein